MFGDVFGCHNWCVYGRKEVISGIWWVEAGDGVKHPTMPRTASPNVSTAEGGKPWWSPETWIEIR